MLSITHFSDTRGRHDEITNMPISDVLVFSGNMSNVGGHSSAKIFMDWFVSLPHEYKIIVPGSRDFYFERPEDLWYLKSKGVHFLINDKVEIEGFTFHGFSYRKKDDNWAYFLPENNYRGQLKKLTSEVDVFISNTPPKGVLDILGEDSIGDDVLLETINKFPKIKLALYGGATNSYGWKEENNKLFVNSCSFTGQNQNIAHEILLKNKEAIIKEKLILEES